MGKVKGLDNYNRSLKALERDIIEMVQDELNIAGEMVVTNVKNDLRTQGAPGVGATATPQGFKENKRQTVEGSGKSRSGTRKPNPKHVPSRPHTPPNSDTGQLMDSYSSFPSRDRLKIYIGSPDRKAFWLEYGTRNMEARPHLVPRYRQQLPVLDTRLKAGMRRIVRLNNGRKF